MEEGEANVQEENPGNYTGLLYMVGVVIDASSFVMQVEALTLVCMYVCVCMCSWFVNVLDGALLVVAHALNAPVHTVLITHLFDYKYIYGIWILEVRRGWRGRGSEGEEGGSEIATVLVYVFFFAHCFYSTNILRQGNLQDLSLLASDARSLCILCHTCLSLYRHYCTCMLYPLFSMTPLFAGHPEPPAGHAERHSLWRSMQHVWQLPEPRVHRIFMFPRHQGQLQLERGIYRRGFQSQQGKDPLEEISDQLSFCL